MDGLELARILYEDYPDISTVIVSGYDDFEYARTVLTLSLIHIFSPHFYFWACLPLNRAGRSADNVLLSADIDD